MNSTLKSLVFWKVLVVVAVFVWNFSTRFQTANKPETFSEFMSKVDSGQGTVGKLLNDPGLYNDLRRLSMRLDSLTSEFKQNPKKFVKLSIF